MCFLVQVPLELLLDMIPGLDPQDILRLETTCRTLHARLHNKEVWKDVLRRTCDTHHIFYPSYPVKDMSVSRLQRASMAPARFARLLNSNASTSSMAPLIQPTNTSRIEIGDPARAERHFLVPGGRFLIIADRCSLRIFDLGPPDLATLPEPILVGQDTLEQDSYTEFICTRLAVHKISECRLRVVVLVGYRSTMVFAYDLTFIDVHVSLEKLGTLKAGVGLDRFCSLLTLSRDVVLVQFTGPPAFSLVWNITEKWYAFGPQTQAHAVNQVIINRTTVVQHDGHHMTIWSCAAEYLRIYPATNSTTVVTSYDAQDGVAIPHFPSPCFEGRSAIDAVRDRCHFVSTSWCNSEDDSSALFDCIHDYRPTVTQTPPTSPTFLRGHRVSIRPSFASQPYQSTPPQFAMLAKYRLSPQPHWYIATDTFLPGCRGLAERETRGEFGFTGSWVSNGQRAVDGTQPRLFLYSVPYSGTDAQLLEDVDAPFLRLACLLEQAIPYDRQVCMASGRVFIVERSIQPSDMIHNFNLELSETRSTAHIYEFLAPCSTS